MADTDTASTGMASTATGVMVPLPKIQKQNNLSNTGGQRIAAQKTY